MRKLFVATVGATIAIVGAGVALAATWPTVTVTPTVSSTKAGTKSNPKGVTLKTVFTWQKLGAANQPVVTKFVVMFPKGSLWQGAKYPTCASPFGVSEIESTVPAGVPPIRTRSPVTSWPALVKSKR